MEATHKAFSLILDAVKRRRKPEEVIDLVLEQCCFLANVVHGSFILVDEKAKLLTITATYGPDWSPEKRNHHLPIGQGVTGTVAQTGKPYLCQDVSKDPRYVKLFSYVKSELAVPVIVRDRIWGVINLDGLKVGCFDEDITRTIYLFAEMVAFAFTLQEEFREQQRMQEDLMQSQKLASLGKVIAGIAHEINNPLTTILGHASMLELNTDSAPDPAAIHAIISESQRAAEIVRTLLEFARKEVGTKQAVDANDLVKQVCEIKRYQLRVNNITIQFDESKEPLPIEASSQQIRQVILNLVNNAEQAIPSQRQGMIRVWAERGSGVVRIKVQDNGQGIPEEVRPHIFDPFFTTKKVGEGTGLGLSMAYSIMGSHHGRLYLDDTVTEGTCFIMEFPSLQEGVKKAATLAAAPQVSSAKMVDIPPSKRIVGRVLVVDDEEGILQFISRFLTAHNIQVTTASDGVSGLEKLRGASFDLVLSDIKMPGLTGLEFYDRAKSFDPNYRDGFIFMSGDLMRESTRDFVGATGCRFIEKPFTGQALRENVLAVLDQRSSLTNQEKSLADTKTNFTNGHHHTAGAALLVS